MKRYANYYKEGSWNVSCQRTGFKVKAENTRMEWNGLIVRDQSWEPRHPQDFLKGIRDEPAVMNARPRPQQVDTNNPNLLVDQNGSTQDGIYWDFGADWALNSGDGWKIDSFATSTDLSGARGKDLPIGVNEPIVVGDLLTLSGFTTLTTRTAGSFIGKLVFYAADRTTIVSTETLFTLSADSAGIRQSGSVIVPDSAYVQVVFDAALLDAAVFELRDIKLEVGTLTGYDEKVSF